MIKLYAFGPKFGLPDASPFCMKAMILLKMAGLDYEFEPGDPRKGPKGKTPWIVDDGKTVADTTFIRLHLEQKYGVDFDKGLSDYGKAVAWAFERLCEDHLYYAVLHERWMVDANFVVGPKEFFEAVPMPMRYAASALVRKQIERDLKGQGLGRHTRKEMMLLARRDVDALAQQLGTKPFMMGDDPTSLDAIAFPTILGLRPDIFRTELHGHLEAHPNLGAYIDRCLALWFKDFEASAMTPSAKAEANKSTAMSA